MFFSFFTYLSVCANLIVAIPLIGETIKRVTNGEFPFIASLQTKTPNITDEDRHFCTGTLITLKDILTAEHCIRGVLPQEIQVHLGLTDVNSGNPKYDVKWMVTYDQWSYSLRIPNEFITNDVAILRLSAMVWQTTIRPATLTELTIAQLYRTKAVIVGWNNETNENTFAKRFRKANVSILTPEECQRRIYFVSNHRNLMENNQFCTATEPYVLTSHGDSGGPLLGEDNNLLGIIAGSRIHDSLRWGNFSEQFISNYEVSIHYSVNIYKTFIFSIARIN